MMPITTVALIARRHELSRELYSRYWRDVHGVLAVRIPGFASYVQHHLDDPLKGLGLPGVECDVPAAMRFDGLAEVGFSTEDDRDGLARSDVAAMIHEDEQNAFRTTLLYNLARGAGRVILDRRDPHSPDEPYSAVLLLGRHAAVRTADDSCLEPLWDALAQHPGVLCISRYALASGNPRDWDTPNVSHGDAATPAYDAIALVQARSQAALIAALSLAYARDAGLFATLRTLHVYPVIARYVMVENGRPTLLALRGLDAQRTIDAVGAHNQCGEALLRKLYGIAPTAV